MPKVYKRIPAHSGVESPAKSIVCDFPGCERTFVRRCFLQRHKICHLSKEQKRELGFICKGYDDCDAHFTSPEGLQNHINIHLDKRIECPVDGCGYSRTDKGAFSRHKKAGIHGPQFGRRRKKTPGHVQVQRRRPVPESEDNEKEAFCSSSFYPEDNSRRNAHTPVLFSPNSSPPPYFPSPCSEHSGAPSPTFTPSPLSERDLFPFTDFATPPVSPSPTPSGM